MNQDATPSVDEVTLTRCQGSPPVAVVTTAAPVQEHQSLYVSTGDCLYALNATDGAARWCRQVTLTRGQRIGEQLLKVASEHPLMSYPPPPRARFATPHMVNGAVYVCVDGFGAYTYAFNADDGSLRWRTPTDGRVGAMPFMDYAVPLVTDGDDGVVYSGTYALNAQDGTVLWRAAIDTREEGALALHALVDDTIYATTQRGIYAINAQGGQIRWLHQPDEESIISGPSVIVGHLLYAGASGSVGHPEKDGFFALDVTTGAEVWRYPHPMGRYIGAVADHESIYVSSGDRSLYALDTKNGRLRWQRQFASPGLSPATIAENILYINIIADGAYALSSAAGVVIWRQPLGNGSGVTFSFYPSVILDGAIYLVCSDKRGKGMLYALNARTGAECWRWRTSSPSAIGPLAVVQ